LITARKKRFLLDYSKEGEIPDHSKAFMRRRLSQQGGFAVI
jgi:hypothetical protein